MSSTTLYAYRDFYHHYYSGRFENADPVTVYEFAYHGERSRSFLESPQDYQDFWLSWDRLEHELYLIYCEFGLADACEHLAKKVPERCLSEGYRAGLHYGHGFDRGTVMIKLCHRSMNYKDWIGDRWKYRFPAARKVWENRYFTHAKVVAKRERWETRIRCNRAINALDRARERRRAIERIRDVGRSLSRFSLTEDTK